MKKIRVFLQDGINSPCYTDATAHLPNQELPLLYPSWHRKTSPTEAQCAYKPQFRLPGAEIKTPAKRVGKMWE